jgi:hypothetical protein
MLGHNGGVAQMVERSLSMREVPGSIPGASKNFFILNFVKNFEFLIFSVLATKAVVAERLRRLTRNQIPSGSVGSNPTDCEIF